ncbi:hypothetical protein ACFU99_44595, partial [Streptomyces sp. NPDC057654]|uniref:hypothetical protein n=1 Tax=Streptomyces sp. NPDC057654 TaxID=3346196 RepID=UPI0036CB88CB
MTLQLLTPVPQTPDTAEVPLALTLVTIPAAPPALAPGDEEGDHYDEARQVTLDASGVPLATYRSAHTSVITFTGGSMGPDEREDRISAAETW